MCSPKQVIAVTVCQGCSKYLCRKHFNEHRDTLSEELQNVFVDHDCLLQELQEKIDQASKPLTNDKAQAVLQNIDEWEQTTLRHVSQTANTAREYIQQLFDRTMEYQTFKQKISKITEELKEQQELESFVETDINNWLKQLEQLTIDLNQPLTVEINPPSLEIQYIDWNKIIKILSPSQTHKSHTTLALNYLDKDYSAKYSLTECPICCNEVPDNQMEKMFFCNHSCCLECIKYYYRRTIQEIRDPILIKRLTCFLEEHEIPDDRRLEFLQYLKIKFNQWFANERSILKKYYEVLYMATRGSRVKICGDPKCSGVFNADYNRIARAQCLHCSFQQCQQCFRKWYKEHTTMTCEQYADWLEDNDPEDSEVLLRKYLDKNGIVCPNEQCKHIYDYMAGGSEHFTCSICRTVFCRICSSLFYNPGENKICPLANCLMKQCLHAHCSLNCYRQIRMATPKEIVKLLAVHKIDIQEELRQKPKATNNKCSVADCGRAPSLACDNRFCDTCYQEFLCLFVWRNQIEPWELYIDNILRHQLRSASVTVPENAKRATLIALARQHLTQFLGKPKPIPSIRRS